MFSYTGLVISAKYSLVLLQVLLKVSKAAPKHKMHRSCIEKNILHLLSLSLIHAINPHENYCNMKFSLCFFCIERLLFSMPFKTNTLSV